MILRQKSDELTPNSCECTNEKVCESQTDIISLVTLTNAYDQKIKQENHLQKRDQISSCYLQS